MITLCTTNFNKEKYLDQFFNSIIKYESNFISEIVIVDDNSTDNSVEIITEWIHKNIIPIKLIQNSSNKWPAIWYQTAVTNAANQYITFLDSDDFLINSSLGKKLQYFQENNNYKIVYWDGQKYIETENKYLKDSLNNVFFETVFKRPLNEIKDYFHTNISNLYVPWSLIKKDYLMSIGWFDTELRSNDWVLNIRIFDNIETKWDIWYSNIPSFAYRISNTNLSNRYKDMEALMVWVANKYSYNKQKEELLENIYFTLFLQCIRNWDKSIAKQYSKKIFKIKRNIKKKIIVLFCLLIPKKIIQSSIIQKRAQKLYALFSS